MRSLRAFSARTSQYARNIVSVASYGPRRLEGRGTSSGRRYGGQTPGEDRRRYGGQNPGEDRRRSVDDAAERPSDRERRQPRGSSGDDLERRLSSLTASSSALEQAPTFVPRKQGT